MPSTTPTPPPGGFQLGGWYNGMQWNGTAFTQPAGVEAIGPNAGQAVNPTVIAATNVAQGLKPGTNEAYIASQNAGAVPGASGAVTGASTTATPAVSNSEVQKVQDLINKRTEDFNKAMLGINDNPFYSEATRVGKANALKQQYNADLVPLNSQLKMATDTYNAQVKAEEAKNKTTVKTFTDNSGNTIAYAIDSQGNVVNQTSLGKVGKATKTGSGTGTPEKPKGTELAVIKEGVASDAKDGHTLQEIVDYYSALGLDVATIKTIYDKNSIYGPAQESLQQITQGQYATQAGGLPNKAGGFTQANQA